MAGSRNTTTHVLLPIAVFLPMTAFLYKYLFIDLLHTGLFEPDHHCPTPFEGKTLYQRHYLGGYAPALENFLCVLVSFFWPILQQGNQYSLFLRDFAVSLSACIVIPFFEASRSNSRMIPGFPMLMGLVYQSITVGVTFPLFWLFLFIFSSPSAIGTEITRGDAESVVAAIIVGYFGPSLAVSFWPSTTTVAAWQIFPVYMTIVATIYRTFRTGGHYYQATSVVCGTYVFLFGISAINHIMAMAVYEFNPQRILRIWIPPFELPSPAKGHNSLHGAAHLLQWDSLVLFSSTFLATFWFVEDVFQGTVLLLWIVVVTVLFGPGATVSSIFFWREKKLQVVRKAEIAALRAKKL